MKKFIVLLILVCSLTIFAEKLTTDGKDNFKMMRGVWYSETTQRMMAFSMRKGFFKIGIYGDPGIGEEIEDYDGNFSWEKLKKLNESIYLYSYKEDKREYREYYAYDTKYKKVVLLDKNLNIKTIYNQDKEMNRTLGINQKF